MGGLDRTLPPVATALLFLSVAPGIASGQGREPAPIRYAGQGAYAAVDVAPAGSLQTISPKPGIAFIYPETVLPPVGDHVGRRASQASTVNVQQMQPLPVRQDRSQPSPHQPIAGPAFDQVGTASWYGAALHGKPTANGEIYDMNAMSAAHPSLPLPSLVQVTNLENNREVVVRVNDRGPFVDGRILDLSKGAANVLGFVEKGEARVRIRYLGPAPIANGPTVETVDPTRLATPVREIAYEVEVPAAPATSRTASPSGAYFVQLGAFASLANAERLKTGLPASLPVNVQPVRRNGADLFRVLVGPWPTERQADGVKDQLIARQYPAGFVVKDPR